MTNKGNSSHIASILSCADILAVLYEDVLNIDSNDPENTSRDRFILSKGHAGGGVYAALAEKGFLDISILDTHYADGSTLSGHVSHKGVPGVEFSTGSLGHGLPAATGMALSAKIDKKKHQVISLLSDGECDEGSNWEAILFASHNKLNNLTAIIDYNKLQSIKSTHETLNLEPFRDKWENFGWYVVEVDGHDHEGLKDALESFHKEKPKCVICHTTKGKGVSFMENEVVWHYRSPQGEEYERAMKELEV
jgi:transketolase